MCAKGSIKLNGSLENGSHGHGSLLFLFLFLAIFLIFFLLYFPFASKGMVLLWILKEQFVVVVKRGFFSSLPKYRHLRRVLSLFRTLIYAFRTNRPPRSFPLLILTAKNVSNVVLEVVFSFPWIMVTMVLLNASLWFEAKRFFIDKFIRICALYVPIL